MFNFFKNHSAINKSSDSFFILLNETARDKIFYDENGVNDDIDGRFELIAFFATAIFLGLSKRGEFADKVSQKVFDTIFKSFDDAMREIGVSDTKVGPKIKKLAEHFYGRLGAYRVPIETNDKEAFKRAISKSLGDNPNLSNEKIDLLIARFRELLKKVQESEI